MPPRVFKDGTIAKGALAAGQVIQLGGFLMTACSATTPTMTSQVIKSDFYVISEFAEQLDPIELSSVNELLDRIAALGVATNYDRIGLKPDQREVNSPPVTHEIAVVEEQHMDYPSILRTNFVRALQAGYPFTGGHDPNPELRIGQHPGAQAAKLGSSSAPGSQIGSGFGRQSTHPPRYK